MMETPVIEGLDKVIAYIEPWNMKAPWMEKLLLAAKRYEELSRQQTNKKEE